MLQGQVDAGLLPGVVAMVGSVDDPEVIVVGVQDLESRTPMSTTSLFHWDSLGKPLTAALALTAVADGTLDLDSPIERWLPELAAPVVLGEPGGQLRHCPCPPPCDGGGSTYSARRAGFHFRF